MYIPDITNGKEKTPISVRNQPSVVGRSESFVPPPQCVNIFSTETPDCMLDSFEYLTTRTFEPNIPCQREAEFLVCCSCEDNCLNRSKCECWQLTQEEAKAIGNVCYSVGYVHNRLKRPQHSA